MSSSFDRAFAAKLVESRKDAGFTSRRDMIAKLQNSGGAFAHGYTILNRIEEGTRALRVGELTAIAALIEVNPADLLPSALDVAEFVAGRGPAKAEQAYRAELHESALQITVEQLAGLALILDVPFEDMYAKLANVSEERQPAKKPGKRTSSAR